MVRMFFRKSTTFLLVMVLLIGCAKGIKDDTIKTQVTSYLCNLELDAFMGSAKFSNYFGLTDVVVKDKLIKEKECIAICTISVRIKQKYQANSGITMAYGFIVGDGAGEIGETKTKDVEFVFKKYEKGWRLKEHVR